MGYSSTDLEAWFRFKTRWSLYSTDGEDMSMGMDADIECRGRPWILTASRGRTRHVPHNQQRIGARGHEIAFAGARVIGRLNHEHCNNNARVKLLPLGTQIRIIKEIFRSAHGFTETWTESDSVRVGRSVFPDSNTEYRMQYHVRSTVSYSEPEGRLDGLMLRSRLVFLSRQSLRYSAHWPSTK
ncbi:hypothetical protein BDW72DRAFT_169573 [Aspergillus terricola var. indicus]